MERLTNSIDFCQMHCDFGRAGGCFFKDKSHCYDNNIYNRLREYEIAEEQGLLLRLPVAIGSTIYHFEYPTKIDDNGTEWSILDKKRATIKPMKFALCHLNGIGKLYFLTKEEAEQALKQMGE